MKRCTYCGKEYPDAATTCAIDAEPLATALAGVPASPKRRLDPLAVLALLLSLFLGSIVGEMPVAINSIDHRKAVGAGLIAVGCLVLELVPLFFSWRLRRREPEVWSGSGWWLAAAFLFALQALPVIAVLISQLFR